MPLASVILCEELLISISLPSLKFFSEFIDDQKDSKTGDAEIEPLTLKSVPIIELEPIRVLFMGSTAVH